MDEAPAVELLWESADPDLELTKRFGFRDGLAAAGWIADVLGQHWGVEVVRCERLVISDRNVIAWVDTADRRLIAKWSSVPTRFARLVDAARLVAWLDVRGFPVAAPITAKDGRLLVELGNDARGRLQSHMPSPDSSFLLGVIPVVEGDLLDISHPEQLEDAGRMLARLHDALAAYPEQIRGRDRPEGAQLVHNDFRSANLLHDGTRITAVLDFEEITYDTRVGDLARSAVLLATRYRDWGPTTEAVRASYVQTYDSHAAEPLTATERRDVDRRIASLLTTFGWT